jgi:triphosphoribosyl-dephospho-CoA synthase
MSPDRIAQCAQLAMLIELSSDPKPGNVDRCHDFSDIGYHHFVISVVSTYPIFRSASSGGSIGRLLLEGVRSWQSWGITTNTHFGSLVLMLPLAVAAGGHVDLRKGLAEVLKGTTADDAVNFYSAFALAGARVADVEEFSLKDPGVASRLREQGKTLLDLMHLSKDHDLIAGEWSSDYERSFHLADVLLETTRKLGLNEGVVRTYLTALAESPDSLVRAKFGLSKAQEVSLMASRALEDETLESARDMDRELLGQDVNPGSTADLIAAALFISLLKGLRF